MKQETGKTVKLAVIKIKEAINLLETIKYDNDEVDEVCEQLSYKIADLEFELNG
jgi:hypothetical protein